MEVGEFVAECEENGRRRRLLAAGVVPRLFRAVQTGDLPFSADLKPPGEQHCVAVVAEVGIVQWPDR